MWSDHAMALFYFIFLWKQSFSKPALENLGLKIKQWVEIHKYILINS